jgi:hypothetical protein
MYDVYSSLGSVDPTQLLYSNYTVPLEQKRKKEEMEKERDPHYYNREGSSNKASMMHIQTSKHA